MLTPNLSRQVDKAVVNARLLVPKARPLKRQVPYHTSSAWKVRTGPSKGNSAHHDSPSLLHPIHNFTTTGKSIPKLNAISWFFKSFDHWGSARKLPFGTSD
ncbi:hypothetical protein PMIN03_004851 [Paraphaeosphaeria minitans]